MKEFKLDLEASINGIYLNSETIELLNIIQCEDIDALNKFISSCSQLNVSEEEMSTWQEVDIDAIKRNLVEQYKNTLVSMEQSIKDSDAVLCTTLIHCGINEEEVKSYISEFKNSGYEGVKKKLKEEQPENYDEFTEKAHRFISTERDQMKSVTYEELCAINETVSKHDTLLVASGRYYDVTKKMYDSSIDGMKKYDFYYAQRGLDFCYKNGKNARYHTLLDKQTMEEHLKGKSKEEVISELKAYVKQSIDFINKYNEKHKINGKGVITSIDLFNEIISFDKPYKNMWQELHGISTEELVDVYKYAMENKPEGVTYVYNEPFLEDEERRKVVIEQLKEINKHAPGLIDTIGTQMHIDMTQDTESIRQCFLDLKKLEEQGVTTQITEFDMCLPERLMFDEEGNISKKYSPEFIYDFKAKKISEISNIIRETGIKLDGITYWSISDTLDHNLERTNRKTFEHGLSREVATTRFAGLYSVEQRERTNPESKETDTFIASLQSQTVTSDIEYSQNMETIVQNNEHTMPKKEVKKEDI